eukprot:GHVT01049148.1.p2 GENE.GHVT01049148.1~~GHVT01049148.1.p2  ORF type:complete len:188 (+),score=25.70 GHVT01049148.1:405-968(+)
MWQSIVQTEVFWQTLCLSMMHEHVYIYRLEEFMRREETLRSDAIQQLIQTFEKRADMLKEELQNSHADRKEYDRLLQGFFQADLPRFNKLLQEELQARDEIKERIRLGLTQEVEKLTSALQAEHEERQRHTDWMFASFHNIVRKVQEDIARECEQREATRVHLEEMLNSTQQMVLDRVPKLQPPPSR